jgi:hypothetical protein
VSTHLKPLVIRRALGRLDYGPPERFGPEGWRFVHLRGDGSVLVTVGLPMEDGHEWIHASMTRKGRTPSYEDMVLLYEATCGGGYAYQVFAPEESHVNIHEYALHLWSRLDGSPALPNFGQFGTI